MFILWQVATWVCNEFKLHSFKAEPGIWKGFKMARDVGIRHLEAGTESFVDLQLVNHVPPQFNSM